MKRLFLPKLCCLLLALCSSLTTRAEAPRETLAKADQAYRAGNFAEAGNYYEKILAEFPDSSNKSSLLYNLGTAKAKAGEPGAAFAYLLRARRLSPTDKDIENSLNFVRTQRPPAEILPARAAGSVPEELFFLSKNLWMVLASLLLLSSSACFYFGGGRGLLTLLLLSSFISSGIWSYYVWFDWDPPVAVVSACQLRSGPGVDFPLIQDAAPGSVLTQKEERDGWLQVSYRLASDPSRELLGWVEKAKTLSLAGS